MKKKKQNQKTKLYIAAAVVAVVIILAIVFSTGELFQGMFRFRETPIVKPSTQNEVIDRVTLNTQDKTPSVGADTIDIRDNSLIYPDTSATLVEADKKNIVETDTMKPVKRVDSTPQLDIIEDKSVSAEMVDIPLTVTESDDSLEFQKGITTKYYTEEVLQTAAPTISSLSTSADNGLIHPGETLDISYSLSGVTPATILYIVVNDNDGNNVARKQFTASEDPEYLSIGSHTWEWNGKDFSGQEVPYNGYKVKVYGKRGQDSIAERSLTIVAIPEALYSFSPDVPTEFPGQVRLYNVHVLEKNYNYHDKTFRLVISFDLQKSEGDNDVNFGFRSPTGTVYYTWDTKDLPNGTYKLFWDGIRYDGKAVNAATDNEFIFWLKGKEKGLQPDSMLPDDLELTFYGN